MESAPTAGDGLVCSHLIDLEALERLEPETLRELLERQDPRADRLSTMSMAVKPLIVALIMGAVGAALVALAGKLWTDEERFHPGRTMGVVETNERRAASGASHRSCWMPVVRYRVAGRVFRHRGECMELDSRQVPVRYDPSNPSDSSIGAASTIRAVGLVGILLCFTGAGLALWARFSWRRRAR